MPLAKQTSPARPARAARPSGPAHEVPTVASPYDELLPEDGERTEDPAPTPGYSVDEVVEAELPKDGASKPLIRVVRNPGITGTDAEHDRLLVVLEEQVRREHDTWNEARVVREAELRYKRIVAEPHPAFYSEYVNVMQVTATPNRRHLRENIQIAACRRIPEMAALEAALRGCEFGRPSPRTLSIAVFERATLSNLRPEFRMNHQAFMGSDLELDWAFFDSPDMDVNRQHVRDESSARKTMKAALERNDPGMTIGVNLALLKRMAERQNEKHGFHNVGRWLVVDGTPIEAEMSKENGVNREHRRMLARRTGARLTYHAGRGGAKGKAWMGWTLLTICDLATGLPVIGRLVHGREYVHVTSMLDELFRRAPWIDPEALIGDAEYDQSARLALDLEARYGIHPVFPMRGTPGSEWEHNTTRGVPECSKHGSMKRHQTYDFGVNTAVPREYVRDVDEARKLFPARIVFKCEACEREGVKLRATTYPKRNARLYTYYPRGGTHRLYATRLALMRRRNAIEGVFAAVGRRGLGDRKHHRVKWATKPVHIQWAVGMALLGQTLRREAHESGLYVECAQEAMELGLLKAHPPMPPATDGT